MFSRPFRGAPGAKEHVFKMILTKQWYISRMKFSRGRYGLVVFSECAATRMGDNWEGRRSAENDLDLNVCTVAMNQLM